MSTNQPVRPHHVVPQLLPLRVRPHHRERTGSFLIRVAEANRCPPWTFLRLLGTIPGGERAQLTPQSCVTLNRSALTRLAAYLGRPIDALTRALPSILVTEQRDEPTVRIHRLGRTFLRSCPLCEMRSGGMSLMPGTHPLELNCRRHNQWLVANEDMTLDQAPEIIFAVKRLRRLRRRRGDEIVQGHYRRVRDYMTNDWRGTRWHRLLVQRWSARQHRMHPAAHPDDEFVRSHTEHWSMLPETVTVVGLLARSRSPLPTADDISRALGLDDYWSINDGEHMLWNKSGAPPTSTVERARTRTARASLPI
jgi:hypothetical protein